MQSGRSTPAAGGGRFTTMAPDDHVPANIAVIEKFLPVSFGLTEIDKGVWEIVSRTA